MVQRPLQLSDIRTNVVSQKSRYIVWQLDPAYFVQAFLVAVGAALLAGIYPSLRLGRMVVATAVREE